MTTNLHFDRLQCPVCSQHFSSAERMKRHMHKVGHTPVYLVRPLEEWHTLQLMREYHLDKQKGPKQ